MVSCLLTLDTNIKAHNALNAMFVETVNPLVFVALTTPYIQSTMRCENSTLLCIKWPLAPPRGKASNMPVSNSYRSTNKAGSSIP